MRSSQPRQNVTSVSRWSNLRLKNGGRGEAWRGDVFTSSTDSPRTLHTLLVQRASVVQLNSPSHTPHTAGVATGLIGLPKPFMGGSLKPSKCHLPLAVSATNKDK